MAIAEPSKQRSAAGANSFSFLRKEMAENKKRDSDYGANEESCVSIEGGKYDSKPTATKRSSSGFGAV